MRTIRRKRTWLGPIRGLLAILVIFDFLGLAIGALQLFNGSYPIGTVRLADLPLHGSSTTAHAPLTFGAVQFSGHPTGAFQIAMFGVSHGLGFVVATLPMLLYAYHVTEEALRKDPFTLTMVRKLRILGALVLVGGLVCEAAAFVAGRALVDDMLSDEPALRGGADLDPAQFPSLWWLLPGLLVLAFAEVVRRGCDLRAELDEVI